MNHYDWVVATQIFLECSFLLGEDFQFDSYFSKGLKPPTSYEDLDETTRIQWKVRPVFFWCTNVMPSDLPARSDLWSFVDESGIGPKNFTTDTREKGQRNDFELGGAKIHPSKNQPMICYSVFQCFLLLISNEQFFLEDFFMSMRKPSKNVLRNDHFPSSPIQVLAAALISSLSFVGLGLAGAKNENQRKSRWRT